MWSATSSCFLFLFLSLVLNVDAASSLLLLLQRQEEFLLLGVSGFVEKLVAAGVEVTPVIFHDDSENQASLTDTDSTFVRSIYFQDPDGILLEFAASTRAFNEDDVDCEPVSVD